MIEAKAKINSFFIFNSTFGAKEGEELKRVLFFHPTYVNPDDRKMQVGLCEAVVKFMTTFSSEPCEVLQTQTKRYIFYQPEKNYWMVLIVRIPYAAKPLSLDNQTDTVQPSVMHNLLMSAYKMFKMFVGPFSDIPSDLIYEKCEQFFTPYISQKNINNDVSDVLQGISYLPLDKSSFFKVLCFIDLVEIKYPNIKCIMFIYNDQLIWNGLSMGDAHTIYQYLVQSLLPEQIEKEIQGDAIAAAQKHGRFISPPEGIKTAADLQFIPKAYFRCDDDPDTKQYYFTVYRTLSATVCFALNANNELELETFRSLDTFIGPQLSTIASAIGEHCAVQAIHNIQTSTLDHKFIYFNRLNLAFKTSPAINQITPTTSVKPEVLSLIAEIHRDRKSLGNYGEIIIKTTDEYWITGKSSNEREFYVVIQRKNANLKEIADEVRRVCDTQMKGIFFYPV